MIKTSLLLLLFSSISYATSFSDGSKKFGLSGGNDACWFDFNNDGWTDVCVGGNVYRNIEGKKFVFITKTGPSVAADFDNDGFLDLYSGEIEKFIVISMAKSLKSSNYQNCQKVVL